ncbi:MAG TPA: hypothetical protein VER96_04935 [Polyangiaceae bacterium]|nr:hypothetical protein [Polyangiaceae bacterium]
MILSLAWLGCSAASSTPDDVGDAGRGNSPGSGGTVSVGGNAASAGSGTTTGGSATTALGGNANAAAAGSAGTASASGNGSGGTSAGTGGTSGAGGSAGSGGKSGGSAGTGGKNGGSAGAGGSSANGGSANAGSGGTGACDWSAPPANVSAWVNESWSSELGTNIKNRKAWNLDNVMLNKGSMNLCVRWGATSAVPATVRMNLASTIQRWFNDWFKALGNYGCFPYGNGITVKVTGWAVKPGQQALLTGIDSSIPVYTETDDQGEPKCPDACSSFVHWDHKFTSCPGGDANHSDYWLWFDDAIPESGAAAVGGDWGLRMPVSTFVDHFNDTSFLICEHEMGHGFGFQDYYSWTGSTPSGGSLMIVGSTGGKQSPTVGDTWLIRRTWKEMVALRGW